MDRRRRPQSVDRRLQEQHAAEGVPGLREHAPQRAAEGIGAGEAIAPRPRHCRRKLVMSRVVHIALKVTDLEKATKFYTEVFGFKETKTGRSRGHISRHLTDGHVDIALMV